jgi:hypothetical protein
MDWILKIHEFMGFGITSQTYGHKPVGSIFAH